jgi:hypothetical protein
MTHAALSPLLGREFDPFLFASVGHQQNGMLLSVLSMFARLDVDPWQEAARLARMSKVTATARLSALIAALPEAPTAGVPIESVAGDLVALLPRPIASATPTPEKLAAVWGFEDKRLGLGLSALALLIFLAMLLSYGPTLGSGKGAGPPAHVETETAKPARNGSDP